MPVGRAVFQGDQTTSADQVVFLNIPQWDKNQNRGCSQCLSSRGGCQEAIESPWLSPHNFTDFGGQSL